MTSSKSLGLLVIVIALLVSWRGAWADLAGEDAASASAHGEVSERLMFRNPGAGAVARSVQGKLQDIVDVADFGARCDGVSDDTAAINAALKYVGSKGPGTVWLLDKKAPCRISATLTVPAGVTLNGGRGQRAGLSARLPNLNPMIALAGDGASIRGIYINAGAAGANTSGTAIAMSNVVGASIDDVYLESPFIGIDLNGNQARLSNSIVNGIRGRGSIGIRVGAATTWARTVDARVLHTSVISAADAPADADLLVLDAGGLIVESSDMLWAKVGTLIAPGENQHVLWGSFSNTYVGDTNAQYALRIEPASSRASVYGIQCNGCWTASAGADNIFIGNANHGKLAAIYFNGLRNYAARGNGARLSGGSFITFDASHFCGNGSGQANILVDAPVSRLMVRNSELGAQCGGLFETRPRFGILLKDRVDGASIVGNDFTGPLEAVGGAPVGNSVVADNVGLDNGPVHVAAASSISVGAMSVASISGTAPIREILPAWAGRSLRLITTDGAVAFAPGGNICAGYRSTRDVPVDAYYDGRCWYLK